MKNKLFKKCIKNKDTETESLIHVNVDKSKNEIKKHRKSL